MSSFLFTGMCSKSCPLSRPYLPTTSSSIVSLPSCPHTDIWLPISFRFLSVLFMIFYTLIVSYVSDLKFHSSRLLLPKYTYLSAETIFFFVINRFILHLKITLKCLVCFFITTLAWWMALPQSFYLFSFLTLQSPIHINNTGLSFVDA